MTERPILFSASMVRAILEGRKTCTRRVVKLHDGEVAVREFKPGRFETLGYGVAAQPGMVGPVREIRCPYSSVPFAPLEVQDRLWVKETWQEGYHDAPNGSRHRLVFHRATDEDKFPLPMKWRPSIFMRRTDSRLALEVTGVRVERLQEITEDDARAEGLEAWTDLTAKAQFRVLWDEINGARPGCSWADNPWVWCINFRRLAQPAEEGR